VHTREAFDRLAGDNRRPVAYAALPHPAAARERAAPAAHPPFRLICFGHLGPNRRLDALLESLCNFPEREQFRLAIYGDIWEAGRLRQRIASLGLDQLVTLHGFVSDAEIDAALAEAHLAVNLRYPTMGEASLSQLQIWDHALPSLVTRAGWYATLPADAVAFVRAEHEWTDVQAQLRAFLADPGHFARMGGNGRRALETDHAPADYARDLVAFAAETQAFQPRAAAFELAARVGGELRAWLGAGTPADALRRVAEEIDALTAGTAERHPAPATAARRPPD
jgi:glycosyltransferase involved in cell wall biosynthesis